MSSTTTTISSGGDQYIHNQKENSERQNVLHQCFRQSSAEALIKAGISDAASSRAAQEGEYKVLEIGCGAGFTTLDLARQLPQATIVAIDTNAVLIADAQNRLKLPENVDLLHRIQFQALSGEQASSQWTGVFDAVWMRFVVVHVPQPVELVQAAAACLKPSGTLLIEDTNANGFISDPPLYANTLIHEGHIEASLKLGADVRRGPLIGRYMRQVGLEYIQCDIFAPVFGKGVSVKPWCGRDVPDPEEHFELGVQLLRMTLESLAPKFLQLEICKEEDIQKARQSIDEAERAEFQLFSLPGGQIFQWWATKPRVNATGNHTDRVIA